MGAAAGGLTLSALSATAVASSGDPVRFDTARKSLRVQPVLVYSLAKRREGTSWRGWGGLHTEKDVSNEKRRIGRELTETKQKADFPMEILPLLTARNPEEASRLVKRNHDVLLMYAASGWVDTLEALTNPDKWTIVFLRHRSGPVYLWYEIISNRYLRKTVDEYGQPGMTTKDVVVDRYDEVLWRLRALGGLKNTLKKKVVCIGGASGWGVGGRKAPKLTQDTFGMELVDVSYKELGQKVTVVDPDFNFKKWVGFEAEIIDNPFLDICRSQIDVQFKGDTDRLNQETKGFHWMLSDGNYLKETEYAIRKCGLDWIEV